MITLCWLVHFCESPLVDNQAPGRHKPGLCEGLKELGVFLNVKVFACADLLRHIRHCFDEAEDFQFDFEAVINHDVQFIDFPNHIDDLAVEVLVND